MKIKLLFIILILLLSGCEKKEEKQQYPKIQYNPSVTNKEKKIQEDGYPKDYQSYYCEMVNDVEQFYNTKLEYFSHINEEDPCNYTVTWNLLDDSEVYRCEVSYERDYIKHSDIGKCICDKSEAWDRWENGEKDLIRYYRMPKEGDEAYPVHPKDYASMFRMYVLKRYSDFNYQIINNQFVCNFYWYQYVDNDMILVYECKSVDRYVVSYKYYHEEIWEKYNKSMKNIKIVDYNDFPREIDYWESYQKDYRKKQEQKKLERYKKMCNNTYVSDYVDLYDEYMQEFEDIEDAYVFYETYCK